MLPFYNSLRMKSTSTLVLWCLFVAVVSTKDLTDEQYLRALTRSNYITEAEEEELLRKPETHSHHHVVPEREIPAHQASRFVKSLGFEYGRPPSPRKDIIEINDQDYAQLLVYPHYITQREYSKILRRGWSMIDSTTILPNRQLPASVMSRMLKSIGFKRASLTHVVLKEEEYLFLLANENYMTEREEEESTKLGHRLGQRLIVADGNISSHFVSLFLKKLKVQNHFPKKCMKDVQEISDRNYLELLTHSSYVTYSEYAAMVHYGVELSRDITVLDDRKLPASEVSKLLKKLKIGAIPLDPGRLSNMAYMALLASPDYMTQTEAKDASKPARTSTNPDKIVLPDRLIDATVVSQYLKNFGVPVNTCNRPTNGAGLSDYDYAKLLTQYRYVTETEFKIMVQGNMDMIDSTIALVDRQLHSKALSKLLKELQDIAQRQLRCFLSGTKGFNEVAVGRNGVRGDMDVSVFDWLHSNFCSGDRVSNFRNKSIRLCSASAKFIHREKLPR